MDAVAKSGMKREEPVKKYQIQPGTGRPNLSGANEDREASFPLFS